MKCECCGVNEATTKDFREHYDLTDKFYVCNDCINRSDNSFWAKMRATQKKGNKNG